MRVLVAAAQAQVKATIDAASAPAEGPDFDAFATVEALLVRLQQPGGDVVMVDLELPDLGGLKGLPIVLAASGKRPVCVLAAGASLELAARIAQHGVRAVLAPQMRPDEFGAALTLLVAGRSFFIAEHAPRNEGGYTAAALLSERELQVLTGICTGLQNKEIAHAFEVQEVTVKMHVRAIIRKLGARNRTHAAMIARDLGIC